MFEHVYADILRFHRTPARLTLFAALRLIVHSFGLQALIVYRGARWLQLRAQRPGGWRWRWLLPLARLGSRAMRWAYGIYLAPEADIGPGLYIGHFGGVHVGRCSIGPGSSIHQQVKIDADTSGRGPVIGARVWIGCHAKLRGPLQVGDGATVGAGAVVEQDIPGQCLVLGSPSRVMKREYDNAAIL